MAKWLMKGDGFYHCSKCGKKPIEHQDYAIEELDEFIPAFCPNCGENMSNNDDKTTDLVLTAHFGHYVYNCSKCDHRVDVECEDDIEEYRYCRHCGRKIKGIIKAEKIAGENSNKFWP